MPQVQRGRTLSVVLFSTMPQGEIGIPKVDQSRPLMNKDTKECVVKLWIVPE